MVVVLFYFPDAATAAKFTFRLHSLYMMDSMK